MKITALVAYSKDTGAIGYEGKIPWHLLSDLVRFKRRTQNKALVMGRKTFLSLPVFLYNRACVVITSKPEEIAAHVDSLKESLVSGMSVPPIVLIHSIEECLTNFKYVCEDFGVDDSEMLIVGGSRVYEDFLPITDTIEATIVQYTGPSDRYFPDPIKSGFLEARRDVPAFPPKNELACELVTFVTRKGRLLNITDSTVVSKLDLFNRLSSNI